MSESNPTVHAQALQQGRLEGRLEALEQRVQRNEETHDAQWEEIREMLQDVHDKITGWTAQQKFVIGFLSLMASAGVVSILAVYIQQHVSGGR